MRAEIPVLEQGDGLNRRKFLSATTAVLGALGVKTAGGSAAISAETTPSRTQGARPSAPNVLVLISDQHRRFAMGVAGDEVAITPNLDRLAQESVRFTEAYCTNPVCAPSRASFLTGLYTHNLESRGNAKPFSFRHPTIASDFARAGYMTALVGKMHMVDAQTHGFDYKVEFNDWLQYLGPKAKLYTDELGDPNSGAGLPEIPSLWRDGDPWKGLRTPDERLGTVAVGRPSLMEERDHFDNFVARESIQFLEDYAKKDEPFLLISSFLKPHDPFMPAARFAEKFDATKMKLSPTWHNVDMDHLPHEVRTSIEECRWTPELKHATAARERMAYYYGNLAQMDDCAGQVLTALTRLGLDRNTIVIYTSDHGEMLGDLGLWNKFQFYEGSCGVPFMVRMPMTAPAVCDHPVSLISLRSTVAELAEVPLTAGSDGRSFAHLVRKPDSGMSNGPVFAEFDLGLKTAKYMIRDGEWKYTFWVHDQDELYNLRDDPQEARNLVFDAAYRQTAERLKDQLFAWHRPAEL